VSKRGWDAFLTAQDKAVFAAAGYGAEAGLGSRPALLVIDATEEFCGPDLPVLQAVERSPLCAGEVAWRAVEVMQQLLTAARAAQLPVVFSVMAARGSASSAGAWAGKRRDAEAAFAAAPGAGQVVAPLQPLDGELVLAKRKPSVFHGTTLREHLDQHGVDTLVLCGGTTSGCVRTTAVDAFSYDYRTVVVEDACFDRGQASHWVSLFDVQQKYGDVLPAADLIRRLRERGRQHDSPGRVSGSVRGATT
jgi:maleamate amidohydrolase